MNKLEFGQSTIKFSKHKCYELKFYGSTKQVNTPPHIYVTVRFAAAPAAAAAESFVDGVSKLVDINNTKQNVQPNAQVVCHHAPKCTAT